MRASIVAIAAAAAVLPLAAQAREVRWPAAHPRVSMIVPNDWTVEETSLGLELQAPQKDSLVLVAQTGADRTSVDGWSRRALERMRSQGVVFVQAGPATPAAPRTAGAADLASVNNDRPYTFGGAPPTIAAPPVESAEKTTAARVGDVDLPTISDFAVGPDATAMRSSGHFLYTGGSLKGQPVDVELTVFPLGESQRLLFEQQSGPLDARGVGIMRSLHDLTR